MIRATLRMCLLSVLAATGLSGPAVAQDMGTVASPKVRAPVQQPALKQQSSPGQRSAQSDCVREANRRGFAVLETSNFQQFRDGWSIDMRVRDQRGRVTQGSCFVETRTNDVSLYGFGWGYDDQGDDQTQFSCSSVESRYRECQLPVNGRARLIKQKSDSPCIEGRTWGQRGDRVWVDEGCRAKFEVTRHGSGSGGSGGANTVDCLSENGRYRECSIGAGYFGRLVREYSNARCRKDITWGTRNGVIWVTDGCRARFERQRGNSGGGNGGSLTGSPGVAKQACMDEAQRRGHRVTRTGNATAIPGGYNLKLSVWDEYNRTLDCTYYTGSRQVRLKWVN